MLVLSFAKFWEKSRSLKRVDRKTERGGGEGRRGGREKNREIKRESGMTVGMGEGEPTEDRAGNRESRRKAAPERGLVPREWNTDQYQEPRRARSACSVQLLRPSEISSCLVLLTRAREKRFFLSP